MCGPSQGENQAANDSQNLANSLSQNYNTNFGASNAILGNISRTLTPIFEAGPNQEGFNATTKAAITGEAVNSNAAAYRRASAVAGANEAGAGGATYAPTGGQHAVDASIATSAAENLGETEDKITQEDYAVGRENFQNAEQGLFGAVSGYNPNATAGAATNATGQAFGEQQQIQQASDAWIGDVAGLVGGLGGAAITSFCPAEGSKYLMADGTEKLVEDLTIGDYIMGIDGTPQTIEEIMSAVSDIIQVVTENGCVTRNSPTHAFALPHGGFVVSARSLGKTIVTAEGNSRVIDVKSAGQARVFNVITDGSHTYRADGVWALGVGEAERYVSMAEWQRVGDRILKAVA